MSTITVLSPLPKFKARPVTTKIMGGAVGVQRAQPFAGARGVLAPTPSSPPEVATPTLKNVIYNHDCDALVIAISATRLYTNNIKKKHIYERKEHQTLDDNPPLGL